MHEDFPQLSNGHSFVDMLPRKIFLSLFLLTVLVDIVHGRAFPYPISGNTSVGNTSIASKLSGWYNEFERENIASPIRYILSIFDNSSASPPPEDLPAIHRDPVDISALSSPNCPHSVELILRQDGQNISVSLPSGLHVPPSECWHAAHRHAEESSVTIEAIGLRNGTDLYDGLLKAHLPTDLFECHNNTDTPLSLLMLSSLRTKLVPLIRSACTELGIPDDVIDEILLVDTPGPTEGEGVAGVRAEWESNYSLLLNWQIRESLAVLGKAIVLVLSPEEDVHKEFDVNQELTDEGDEDEGRRREEEEYRAMLSSSERLAPSSSERLERQESPQCMYLGGNTTASIESARNALQRTFMLLLSLFGASQSPSTSFDNRVFYPSDTQDHGLNNFSLRIVGDYETVADGERWFSMSINGAECATIRLSSLLEAEGLILRAPDGLGTITRARELLSFLEKTGDSRALQRLKRSQLAERYQVLANAARNVLTKASLQVTRVNLAECGRAGTDQNAVDVIFVDYPTAGFVCGDFPAPHESSSLLCASNGSVISEEFKAGVAVFVIPQGSSEMMMYTDAVDVVDVMRNGPLVPSASPESE